MNLIAKSLLLAAAICFASAQCYGHGTPIFVSVNAVTGQLVADNGFDPGEFLPTPDGGFADAPGLAVTSQFVGLAFDEMVHINVVQELLFWDGLDLREPSDSIAIERPLGPGSSLVNEYTVSASSGYQTGMLWGKFDGTAGWHADGKYVLESTSPQTGIYGVVLQLESELHIASEPFLVPLVFDPFATLGANRVTEGIDQLQQAMILLPTADFDRNSIVDSEDLFRWQQGFGTIGSGTQVQGDATLDGNIAGNDFLTWQQQVNLGVEATAATWAVPEPSTLVLLFTFCNLVMLKGKQSS